MMAGMSDGAAPVLHHIDLPVMAGSKLTVWTPLDCGLLGSGPLRLGHGFTVDVAGDRWRAVVETLSVKRGGTQIELGIEGRYRDGDAPSMGTAGAGCPHGRESWHSCPHCIGLNTSVPPTVRRPAEWHAIPDEIVHAAQDYDREHRGDDGQRGGSWGSVPPGQVRRIVFGALEALGEDGQRFLKHWSRADSLGVTGPGHGP